MDERRIEFDWDEANVGHVARHRIRPDEAEQVILNDPLDLGMEIVEGEERYINLGATSRERILPVTTWRENRVRVVAVFEPIKQLVQFYYQERGGYREWPTKSNRVSRLRRKKPGGGL